MNYYISRLVALPFDAAVVRTIECLKTQGFGVLTDIDIQATLHAKLGIEMRKYRILGACNPSFAHQALQLEDRLGVLLPCNVIVREAADGQVEIASVDPVVAMEKTGNPLLVTTAQEVRRRLVAAIDAAACWLSDPGKSRDRCCGGPSLFMSSSIVVNRLARTSSCSFGAGLAKLSGFRRSGRALPVRWKQGSHSSTAQGVKSGKRQVWKRWTFISPASLPATRYARRGESSSVRVRIMSKSARHTARWLPTSSPTSRQSIRSGAGLPSNRRKGCLPRGTIWSHSSPFSDSWTPIPSGQELSRHATRHRVPVVERRLDDFREHVLLRADGVIRRKLGGELVG